MAALQKIRAKAGLFIIVIVGIALFSFVFEDFFRSGKSAFSKQTEIANVAGKSINYQTYQAKLAETTEFYEIQSGGRAIDEQTREQIKESVWSDIVKQGVLESELATLGLGVSSKELLDLTTGQNMDPMVRRIFTDPNTGQVNTNQLLGFLKNFDKVDEKNKSYWLYIEKKISERRLDAKYDNLVAKGIYVTKAEIENGVAERSHQFDMDYIQLKYETVADKDVKITDDDLKTYYNEHKSRFKQERSRDVVYVNFDVNPSPEDKAKDLEWITKMKADFAKEASKDVDQFVNANADNPAIARFYKKGELTDNQVDTFMFAKANVGDIYGPYIENGAYKIARLIEAKPMPDSVKVRHILVRPDEKGAIKTMEAAEKLIDSLKNVVAKDSSQFAELAKKYSSDGSANKGGDLGWFEQGKMVPAFNDSAFATAKGGLKKVKTQFGYHLIQVLDRGEATKKVKVAIIDRVMKPSKLTRDHIYAQANKFAAEATSAAAFENTTKKMKLAARMASNLRDIDKGIPGIESAREMVRWAYNAKKGDVSKVFDLNEHYVIAVLQEIHEKGIASFEEVKTYLVPEVTKKKKAEILIAKVDAELKQNNSLAGLSGKLNAKIETATNISFSSYQTPAGNEEALIATASVLPANSLSKAIEGQSGVFVVMPKNVRDVKEQISFAAERYRLSNAILGRAFGNMYQEGEVLRALKEKYNVEDNRAKFE